ncbi:hypothetical protein AGMMS50218_14300 [Actinomycetota bacterium]|nr:hypothetical protein AGMMS50218_14300 [Actinomycetota bacterium]
MAGPPPSSLLPRLLGALVEADPGLVDTIAATIRAEVPGYRTGAAISAADLRADCAVHLTFLLGDAARRARDEGLIRSRGAARARSRLALADLLDAQRVGFGAIWAAAVAHARSTRTVSEPELVDVASEVWWANDTFARLMEQGYHAEATRSRITRERERFGLVYALLGSPEAGAGALWQAVDALGLPRSSPYLVTAARSAGPGTLALPSIEADLAAAHVVSAWVLLSDVQLGIVGIGDDTRVPLLRRLLTTAGATAGLSPVFTDYGRTAQAARLARTALAATAPGLVLAFADAPLDMAAAGSPDVGRQVADTVLGGLLGLPDAERRLLVAAAEAWFAAGGSVTAAAGALYVHPNTVRNRLRRLEQLTGRALAGPREAAEVYLALVSLRQQGWPAEDAEG